MVYNLYLFGEKVLEMRTKLKFTQREIANLVNIDSVTLRRIEKGKVVPKLDTLELLSPIFKEDLISMLLRYRFDDYSVFYDLKNRIESKLDNSDFLSLEQELIDLNNLSSSTNNMYYKILIAQLVSFVNAITFYKGNNSNAMDKLIESITITSPNFKLDSYNLFVYSSMEIRILMNIAFVINKSGNQSKYLEILEFCMNSIDFNDEIYSKICHNLAGAYIRNKQFGKALEYYNLGIKSCQKNRYLNGINRYFMVKELLSINLIGENI